MDAYITDLAVFLPNSPVGNEDMENVLGVVHGAPSRVKKIILRRNGIHTRYYAIDPHTGHCTHSNAELTAEAVRRLAPYEGFSPADIQCLSCGTTTPDQLQPGHAAMVHGELGGAPCEIMSAAGICLSGVSALKYAAMNVALGLQQNAVATGSEQLSAQLRGQFCGPIPPEKSQQVEKNPALAFEADFLRFMLSDGAGAAFLQPAPAPGRLSLKIEWIEYLSFAHELETCMYGGAQKDENGALTGWRQLPSLHQAVQDNVMLLRQDVKLLNKEIPYTGVERTLPTVIKKYGVTPDDVDWFLPHYSSDYFRKIFINQLEGFGFPIPEERWFTNLPSKGNTGAASIFIILEELYRSGNIKPGQKLLCFIPESGRFSMSYMLLRAVEG